jgi:hypothetical protein
MANSLAPVRARDNPSNSSTALSCSPTTQSRPRPRNSFQLFPKSWASRVFDAEHAMRAGIAVDAQQGARLVLSKCRVTDATEDGVIANAGSDVRLGFTEVGPALDPATLHAMHPDPFDLGVPLLELC